MIDTIVLNLKRNMFVVLDKAKFYPLSQSAGDSFFRKWVRNPSKRETNIYGYLPKLTYIERPAESVLKVEFSAPKLIFGNNFDELEDKDFEKLIIKLKQQLKLLGVNVFESLLINTPISAIHYSKNIPLTDGSSPYVYLKEIKRANINLRLDFNQSDFRNEGHSLKFRTNSFEITFYDKVKDLEKAKISEKRAIEKDNFIQLGLFEGIREIRKIKPLEILRMEIRLNQPQKIRQVLRKTGLETELTFQNLFKKKIARKVLLYYLDQIESSYPKLLYFKPKTAKDFIAQFMIDNPKTKLKDPFVAFGFYKTLEEITTREIRELLKKYPEWAWYRFYKKINRFDYPKTTLSVFEPIKNSIEEFKPFKLVDFKLKMLNNDKYD